MVCFENSFKYGILLTYKFFLASHLASLRKANEANQPKPPISSPAEFSRLKYDREMKLQERQEQYRQQMIAQQRVSLTACLTSALRLTSRQG